MDKKHFEWKHLVFSLMAAAILIVLPVAGTMHTVADIEDMDGVVATASQQHKATPSETEEDEAEDGAQVATPSQKEDYLIALVNLWNYDNTAIYDEPMEIYRSYYNEKYKDFTVYVPINDVKRDDGMTCGGWYFSPDRSGYPSGSAYQGYYSIYVYMTPNEDLIQEYDLYYKQIEEDYFIEGEVKRFSSDKVSYVEVNE